jgi:hypothetical protein
MLQHRSGIGCRYPRMFSIDSRQSACSLTMINVMKVMKNSKLMTFVPLVSALHGFEFLRHGAEESY